jgi:hypothetical protein
MPNLIEDRLTSLLAEWIDSNRRDACFALAALTLCQLGLRHLDKSLVIGHLSLGKK